MRSGLQRQSKSLTPTEAGREGIGLADWNGRLFVKTASFLLDRQPLGDADGGRVQSGVGRPEDSTMKNGHRLREKHGDAWHVIERSTDVAWIRTALKRSRVVALLGPRQCGKTTLARGFVPASSVNYFDLERPDQERGRAGPISGGERIHHATISRPHDGSFHDAIPGHEALLTGRGS